jgi:BMFP domain-containing protein YqiC
LSEVRSENSQLELKIKELEAQLEKINGAQSDQAPDEQEAA